MENLQNVIDKLAYNVVQLLDKQGQKVATAESCTGGTLSGAITSVSGSSKVFELGVCTYANWAKHKMISVPNRILIKYGAVSQETAQLMAEGIRERAGADYGIATTGLAGPDGGTEDKPVGTVFVAISTRIKTTVVHLTVDTENLPQGEDKRDYIRKKTVIQALMLLQNCLTPNGTNNSAAQNG